MLRGGRFARANFSQSCGVAQDRSTLHSLRWQATHFTVFIEQILLMLHYFSLFIILILLPKENTALRVYVIDCVVVVCIYIYRWTQM